MNKVQLEQYLRQGYLFEQVLPVLEVNPFFETPSDANVVTATATNAVHAWNNATVTVPADEAWLIVKAGGIWLGTANAELAAGTQGYLQAVLTRSSGAFPLCDTVQPAPHAAVAAQQHRWAVKADLEHNLYCEGGSVIYFTAFNGDSVAAATLYLTVMYIPIGKNVR